jgi:hypothetical protein
MQNNSPFSPDFSPCIPDFSSFSPDFSPSEFRLHSSVLDCSVIFSTTAPKIMIIGDRRRRSTRKATKSHLKMEKNVSLRQDFSPKKMGENVVFQIEFFSMKNGEKSGENLNGEKSGI